MPSSLLPEYMYRLTLLCQKRGQPSGPAVSESCRTAADAAQQAVRNAGLLLLFSPSMSRTGSHPLKMALNSILHWLNVDAAQVCVEVATLPVGTGLLCTFAGNNSTSHQTALAQIGCNLNTSAVMHRHRCFVSEYDCMLLVPPICHTSHLSGVACTV